MFTCLVVVTSTLAWIAGVAFALVYFLGLSETAGWWIVGSLAFSSAVAMTVIFYEMRHALDISPTAKELGTEDSAWDMPKSRNGRYSKA